MKVFFVTEGGRHIGFGHIARCISLYDAFKGKDIVPEFIINSDRSSENLLEGRRYKYLNWLKEKNVLLARIHNADIVIIDSYLADKGLYKDISETVRTPVYIDDNNRISYPRGVVLNGSIYAKELNYPENAKVSYLLGVSYALIRKNFWDVREKNIRKAIKTVMITFGGDDDKNMTPKILEFLNREYPYLVKKVIIGMGFKNISSIKSLKEENADFIYYPDAIGMEEVMMESDIAISAAGQTLYELGRIGVPTIAINVAENQRNNVEAWSKAGFICHAGAWADSNMYKNINIFMKDLRNRKTREGKSKIGRKLVDGKGSKRVVDYLLSVN